MIESPSNQVDLSIIVPVLNEEDSILSFIEQAIPSCEALKVSYEIIFVNDGSTDDTLTRLKQALSEHSEVKIINLARNFGKELALTSGLNYAKGQAIIPMDVDLQDPPELIPLLYKKYLDGFDVVIAIRKRREGDSYSKRLFANGFYKLFKRMSSIDIYENGGDFRIMSRRVVDVVNSMHERTRFMKGILSWPGFKTTAVEYDRPNRIKGKTKWSFSKLFNLALDGIFSFSTLPLKVWTYIGAALSLTSITYMIFTILKTIVTGIDVPGYASLLVVTLLIGGVNLMGIGIIGEYIGRIFVEVKSRPLYVIESILEDKGSNYDDSPKKKSQGVKSKDL